MRVPFYLTLIKSNGDLGAAWQEEASAFGSAVGGGALGVLTQRHRTAIKELFMRVPFIRNASGGEPVAGPFFSGLLVAANADPYVVLQSGAQATAVTPQSQLASGSGTLFGYGYRASQ